MARSFDDGNDGMGGERDPATRQTRRERLRHSRDRDEDAKPVRRRARADAELEPQRSAINSIRPSPRRVLAAVPSRDLEDAGRPRDAANRGALAGRDVIPDEIRQRFVQVGHKYHFPDGTRAFTDHGKRLTSPSENTEVIKSLVAIAQARGWSDITVSGTERFKKEAWFAARSVGLDVRGYSPTEFEQSRLVRMLARSQALPSPSMQTGISNAPSASQNRDLKGQPRGGEAHARSNGASRERTPTLQVGRLVDHGAAPYRHDHRNDPSYFVRIETPSGEREIWGVDLQRALNESLTRPRIGDEIGIRALRRDAVKIRRPEHDAEGRIVGTTAVEAHRNGWIVEKREFFRERSQAARVLRDASVDRQQAVKQHPELLGTYLQLHAAELAAKTLRNPENRQRFVASVRTALADAVARGEPLSPVPLKEPSVLQQETSMSNVPSEVKINAIAANLKALQALLSVAAARSAEAHQLIHNGECNGAIGTVLELDRILDDAKALYGAAIALHRLRAI